MQKLINYLLINGKKNLSENIFLKISKELNKISKKSFKKIIKLSFIKFIFLFKTNKVLLNTNNIYNKKKISIINKNKIRISFAIKFVIKYFENKKSQIFYKIFSNEIFLILKNLSFIEKEKKSAQETIFLKKHILLFYR